MGEIKKAQIKVDIDDILTLAVVSVGVMAYMALRGLHSGMASYYKGSLSNLPKPSEMRHLTFHANMQSATDALRKKQTALLADYLQNKVEQGGRRIPAAPGRVC